MNSSTSLAAQGMAGAASLVLLNVAKHFHWDLDNDTAVAVVLILSAAAHAVARYLPAPKAN